MKYPAHDIASVVQATSLSEPCSGPGRNTECLFLMPPRVFHCLLLAGPVR